LDSCCLIALSNIVIINIYIFILHNYAKTHIKPEIYLKLCDIFLYFQYKYLYVKQCKNKFQNTIRIDLYMGCKTYCIYMYDMSTFALWFYLCAFNTCNVFDVEWIYSSSNIKFISWVMFMLPNYQTKNLKYTFLKI
jgi:hypothetical protein